MDEKFFAIPYIGVCDVGSHEHILKLREYFPWAQPLALKAGITMTRKVLWGVPTEFEKVCPPAERIREIFSKEFPLTLNVIHYADDEGVDLAVSLKRLIELGGPHLHAIQLDMIWPDPSVLEECKKAHPKLQFILQVGGKALAQISEDPLRMWEALKNYDGLAERILLDRSMGTGKKLEARSLVRFVDILYERMKEPGVVVAGGLGPKTLHLVEPLLAMYPRLSIDAQSALHEGGKLLSGPISMLRAIEYTLCAVAMHQKYNVMA